MIKILSDYVFVFVVLTSFSNSDSSSALCQNLYFQPKAIEKLKENNCDIVQVEEDIQKVKSWDH